MTRRIDLLAADEVAEGEMRMVWVDGGTSPIGVAQFVLAMRAVSGGDGVSLTVPVSRTDLPTP